MCVHAQLVFLSEDSVSFGDIPVCSRSSRLLFLINLSHSHSLHFTWDKSHQQVRGHTGTFLLHRKATREYKKIHKKKIENSCFQMQSAQRSFVVRRSEQCHLEGVFIKFLFHASWFRSTQTKVASVQGRLSCSF